MEYTPFADPFVVKVEKNGYQYEASVVYARSKNSCTNIFDVRITRPSGIAPFCLREKDGNNPKGVIWVDEKNKESLLYQLIGHAIAAHLKEKLGILMMDRLPEVEKKRSRY